VFGRVGYMELGIVVFIVVLIFGPRQIPRLGKAFGDTIRSFRQAGRELTGDDQDTDAGER
jgi:sec-independent protein translocase protein TatA